MATLTSERADRDAVGFVFDKVSWDDDEAMLRIEGRDGEKSAWGRSFRVYVREHLVPRPES